MRSDEKQYKGILYHQFVGEGFFLEGGEFIVHEPCLAYSWAKVWDGQKTLKYGGFLVVFFFVSEI